MGGISGPCPPPKREMCPPSEKYVPSSEDCAQKESNRAGATGMHFGAYTPKILLVIPSSVGKVSLQDEKHKWITRRPKTLRWRLFLFSVFTPEFAGKNRDPHHKILLRPARLWRPIQSENWTPKEGKRPVSTGNNLGFFCLLPPVTLIWLRACRKAWYFTCD